MHGLMMDRPLLITSIIQHAATTHGDTEVVSRSVEGPIHRTTYRDCYGRICRLAHALDGLGIERDDRIATLAWSSYRHLELYYAISGIGAVCHTVNPRLFKEQITYILNHAHDRFVFTDTMFVPLLEELAPSLQSVEGFIIMTDPAHMPDTSLANAICYEELIANRPDGYEWPELDERTAAGLCYTSGTTGNPKGALYSHRSTVIHALGFAIADGNDIKSRDVIMPIVPMFHVMAWGLPYIVPMCGAKLVLPGPKLDGSNVHELIESEGVTIGYGVPTVWLGLLDHLRQSGKRVDSLRRLLVGGAAPPLAMIEAYEDDYGVDVLQGWGMTETSPVGATSGCLKAEHERLPRSERHARKLKLRTVYGVETRMVDDDGREVPRDGKSAGELQVRGPWVAAGYYRDEAASAKALDDEGWFRTGDVGIVDTDGYFQLTDRVKDLIKSGGEWISSIDLENTAMGHPNVAEAAAIAITHPKWGERPLLVITKREGSDLDRDAMLDFLRDKVVKWWLPDDVVFVDALPHTATGKIAKRELREWYKDYRLPTV